MQMKPRLAATAAVVFMFGASSSSAQSYSVTQLALVAPGSAVAFGLNDGDQIVGVSYYGASGSITSAGVGTLWNGTAAPVVLGSTSGASEAVAVNNSGVVAGVLNGQAVIWNATTPTTLTPWSSGTTERATGINASGQVIGVDVAPATSSSAPAVSRAIVWNGLTPTALNTLGGPTAYATDAAYGINNEGVVVGTSAWQAVVWTGGTPSALGSLNAPGTIAVNIAHAINDANQIVGESDGQAVLWNNSATPTVLDAPKGNVGAVAEAINNAGQIVGSFSVDVAQRGGGVSVDSHAVEWIGATAIDLNTYLPASITKAGWSLADATSINDQGDIVAYGYNTKTSASAAFLLRAVPEASSAWFLAVGAVALAWRARSRELPRRRRVATSD